MIYLFQLSKRFHKLCKFLLFIGGCLDEFGYLFSIITSNIYQAKK